MILLADSGSTKAEWRIIKSDTIRKSHFTSGINPYFLSSAQIFNLLNEELGDLSRIKPEKIYFYGTGCNSDSKNLVVRQALENFFSTDKIVIGSDLLGAARALCQREPGIACIMGTGSNSCYYNGSDIVSNVAPLGYILGDEGGSAVLGRKLVSGVLKKQVPASIIQRFYETYKLSTAEILENVYMKPFPNRFLGQFSRFISANIEVPEMQEIIISSFDEFIKRNVAQYPEAKILQVNFTGSIAFHFREFLEIQLIKNNLQPGKITLSPMENLTRYHMAEINQIERS
jgi:glucosamine kinase